MSQGRTRTRRCRGGRTFARACSRCTAAWRSATLAKKTPKLSPAARRISRARIAVKGFGVPVMVAVQRFATDTDAEVRAVETVAEQAGVPVVECSRGPTAAQAPKRSPTNWSNWLRPTWSAPLR